MSQVPVAPISAALRARDFGPVGFTARRGATDPAGLGSSIESLMEFMKRNRESSMNII